MYLIIWPIAFRLSPSWEWLVTLDIAAVSDVFCDNVWTEQSSQHTSLNGITVAESFRGREVRG